MFEPAQTYEGEMSFDHEDDLNHLFKSFICIVARATGILLCYLIMGGIYQVISSWMVRDLAC